MVAVEITLTVRGNILRLRLHDIETAKRDTLWCPAFFCVDERIRVRRLWQSGLHRLAQRGGCTRVKGNISGVTSGKKSPVEMSLAGGMVIQMSLKFERFQLPSRRERNSQ